MEVEENIGKDNEIIEVIIIIIIKLFYRILIRKMKKKLKFQISQN